MDGISTGLAAVVLGIVGFTLYQVADTLAGHWRKNKAVEFAASLKQQMIDKGFTADEIVRVLAAEAEAPTAAAGAVNLTADLIESGYEAAAVADITAAVDGVPAGLRDEVRAAVAKMVETGYDGDDILTFISRRADAAAGATVA